MKEGVIPNWSQWNLNPLCAEEKAAALAPGTPPGRVRSGSEFERIQNTFGRNAMKTRFILLLLERGA